MRAGRPGLARLKLLAPTRSRTVDAVLVALAAAMAFASYSANLPFGAAAFGRSGLGGLGGARRRPRRRAHGDGAVRKPACRVARRGSPVAIVT